MRFMSSRRLPLLALLLLLAAPAAAECIRVEGAPAAWLVEIEIETCRPAAEAAEERLGTTSIGWIARAVRGHVESEPGVVLTGRVVERLGVEVLPHQQYLLHGGLETVDLPGTWFLADDRPDACAALVPGTVVELYQPDACCCGYPPHQVHCVLEMGLLTPVPPALAALVGPGSSAAGAAQP